MHPTVTPDGFDRARKRLAEEIGIWVAGTVPRVKYESPAVMFPSVVVVAHFPTNAPCFHGSSTVPCSCGPTTLRRSLTPEQALVARWWVA